MPWIKNSTKRAESGEKDVIQDNGTTNKSRWIIKERLEKGITKRLNKEQDKGIIKERQNALIKR